MRRWDDFLQQNQICLMEEDSTPTKNFHWDNIIPGDVPLTPHEQALWEAHQDQGATCFMEMVTVPQTKELSFAYQLVQGDSVLERADGKFKSYVSNPRIVAITRLIKECRDHNIRHLCLVTPNIPAAINHETSLLRSVYNLAGTLKQEPEMVIRWRPPSEEEKTLIKALGVQARRSSRVIHSEDTRASSKFNRKSAEDWIRQTWVERWRTLNQCRQTKIFFPTPNPGKSKELLHLDRQKLGNAIQFITGHCYLQRHKWIIDDRENPNCRLCREEFESPEHLFFRCPWVAKDFDDHKKPLPSQTNWSVDQLMWLLDKNYMKNLMHPTYNEE